MSMFQKSVVNKYLKSLDNENVIKAYQKFQVFFGDKLRLHNIMQLKEENYQEGFLRDIFSQTLGYTLNPDHDYNLTTEFKNQKDSRKTDGAILKDGKAIGVIELKSTKTKDLESIKEQAFGYKNNQPDCKYVITSNFKYIRFYIDNATDYEEFNLFDLSEKEFRFFYLLLSKESIFSNLPQKLKQETKFHEKDITEKLYKDYQDFKNGIFANLVSANPQYDKLTLFRKSQKLMDRFLFVFFAEDAGLIPPNTISKIISDWISLKKLNYYQPLYTLFANYFTYLDKGKSIEDWGEIPAYNGGLFQFDEILDASNLRIPDELLHTHTLKLSAYDFSSEVDVNILGHIFEHSLNEIEEMQRELNSPKLETTEKFEISKRKKEGIFYTPKYITQYIIENTVGLLCIRKKEELKINDLLIDETFRKKDKKLNTKGKDLFETLNTYKEWLLTLKIIDPACGSGAFLNQTLEFLINEHKLIDNFVAELTGEKLRVFDTDKQILENNIYGVDINDESVEIAKLSLWLRTAKKGRILSNLTNNIKCGNSLIDNHLFAGEKAFKWNDEFKEIMDKGGFDVVLGNPPYVSANNMPFLDREYFNKKSEYKTLKGKWDLYIPFIEKSIVLLKKQGLLSVVIPYNFLNQPYAEPLRKHILENCRIHSIADLHQVKVFESATVPSCIIVIEKNITDNYPIYIDKFENFHIVNNFSTSDIDFKENEQTMFRTENRNFSKPILEKIKKTGKPLGNYFYVSTGAEIHGKEKRNNDNSLTSGNSKYDVLFNEFAMGYKPYIQGSAIPKSEKGRYCYPKIDFYLNYDAKVMRSPKFPELFENEKILIRSNAGLMGLLCTFDDRHLYTSHNTIIIIDKHKLPKNTASEKIVELKFLLALLNSRLMNFYFKSTVSGFIAVYPNDLKQLPISIQPIENQQNIIQLVDIILTTQKELSIRTHKFANYLKDKYNIEKLTEKLENWYNLSNNEFFVELKKNNIKLTIKDEISISEYFEDEKNEISVLNSRFMSADNEINRKVYDLYELSADEIEIVENSGN